MNNDDMNEKIEQFTKLTPEQWQELDVEMRNVLEQVGIAFGLWLYNNKDAKNFIKVRFGDKDFGFDLVLRKRGSDSNVICSFCANTDFPK
jgi:hypothetical protein